MLSRAPLMKIHSQVDGFPDAWTQNSDSSVLSIQDAMPQLLRPFDQHAIATRQDSWLLKAIIILHAVYAHCTNHTDHISCQRTVHVVYSLLVSHEFTAECV